MYGQYTDEFYKEMEQFEARYGYSFWWMKGGYWSSKWQDLFNKFGGKMPASIAASDYAIEGSGIAGEGLALIASGIQSPDTDSPTVALEDQIIGWIESQGPDVQTTMGMIGSMAQTVSELSPAILAMHADIIQRYNAAVQVISAAAQKAVADGVPLAGDYYGLTKQDIGDYPVYATVPASIIVEYASVMIDIDTAYSDVEKSISTRQATGMVARYMHAREKAKSSAWKVVLAAGFVLTTLGIVAVTVTAKKHKSAEAVT